MPRAAKGAMPFTILDSNGAVVEGQLSISKLGGRKLHNWIHIFEQGLLKVCNAKLTGYESTMLFFLLSQVDFDNRVCLQRSLCYANTNIQPKHQYGAINGLIKKALLYKADKINSLQFYKLNPLLAWKGNAKNYPNGIMLLEHLGHLEDCLNNSPTA